MANLPKPTHFTENPGGDWIKFEDARALGHHRMHAIAFEDGNILDIVNGWRARPITHPNPPQPKVKPAKKLPRKGWHK